ncbi:PPPDE putative peptidase domain-containing protein [Chytriomyces cf. hyalinus JEL632]|nr:PPPDE putative peptidase domain-containing protein [Chytriomyces cf. hyalinus JEL632]
MPRVQLYLYDLSQGMAAAMSVALTGKHIPGIWHTSVVVFGKEVYFGQGIAIERPETTPHGRLVERIEMGETEIPEEVFWEYVDTMKQFWTADKYHLFDNNCNSFSNEVCQFLVGKQIPPHITGLPKEFLATPFGQQLAPMIEAMFGPSRVAAEHRPQPDLNFTTPIPAPSPKHAHLKANIPSIRNLSRNPILFSQSSDFEMIFAKLGSWIQDAGISGVDVSMNEIKERLQERHGSNAVSVGQRKAMPHDWWSAMDRCLNQLKQDQLFPLLDVLRLLVLDETVAASLTADSPSKLMSTIARFQAASHVSPLPKSLHLMLLRLTCNAFAHSSTVSHCLSLHLIAQPQGIPHRTVTTAVLIDGLLSEDNSVRQCAASLAFNMALESVIGKPPQSDEVYDEWCLEMLAAVINALENEQGDEIVLRLLSSLGHLVYCATEQVLELATVLGCKRTVAAKAQEFSKNTEETSARVKALAKELDILLS